MKILVINGSPKGERSDTMHLTRAFLEGMEEEAEIIDAMKVKVGPCRGCFACWGKTNGVCIQKDDMPAILEKILAADLVIWSTPMYFFSLPAPCKVIIDRLFVLAMPAMILGPDGYTTHPERIDRPIPSMLIAGAGFPDREGNFDGLIFQFNRSFGGKRPMILCPESPLLGEESAGEWTAPYLAAVRKAGAEYKRDGGISPETQAILDAPMMDPEIYRENATQADGV